MTQVIRDITRPASGNILDLLITSNPGLVSDAGVYPGISDHDVILFTFSGNPRTAPKTPRKIFQYHKANHVGLKDAVSTSPPSSFYHHLNSTLWMKTGPRY